MGVAVKICGLNDHEAVAAAVHGGAGLLGFVFYPPSPRAVTPKAAAKFAKSIPPDRTRVGVVVDPDDALLDEIMAEASLDAIQLHGRETPERVRAVKARTGKAVIKALAIGKAADLAPLAAYADAADMLLFDARPPKSLASLPGGNGLSFDWRLIAGLTLRRPWLLSGGLNADNLAEAVRLCRASMVDVSSGVETAPGVKDATRIRAFLHRAAALPAAA